MVQRAARAVATDIVTRRRPQHEDGPWRSLVEGPSGLLLTPASEPRGHRHRWFWNGGAGTTCCRASAPACWRAARSRPDAPRRRRRPHGARRATPTAAAYLSTEQGMFRVDFAKQCDARVMVYGQTEVTAGPVRRAGQDRRDDRPRGRGRHAARHRRQRPTSPGPQDGREHRLDCDFVAGCDGYHGVSRTVIPADRKPESNASIPLAGSGILSRTAARGGRADLCQPPARLRPGVDAQREPVALLHPGAAGRHGPRRGPTRRSGRS